VALSYLRQQAMAPTEKLRQQTEVENAQALQQFGVISEDLMIDPTNQLESLERDLKTVSEAEGFLRQVQS